MRKIKPYIGSDGYYQVARKENGKVYRIRVHRLFAILFIDNPYGCQYVNHIDSDKLNNALENLEWCSNSYNVQHGWDSGNRTHKNRTKVCAKHDGEIKHYTSIRKMCEDLHLDRHKVARILKGEIPNRYKYEFSYA